MKLLPAADKTVYTLLKSYLNSNPLPTNTNNSKVNKLKFLSMIKVFIGRPEIKHNNNQVTITIYTYNRKKVYFLTKIKKLFSSLNLTNKKVEQKTKNTFQFKTARLMKINLKTRKRFTVRLHFTSALCHLGIGNFQLSYLLHQLTH